jgi:hypothetical protein
MAAHLLMGPVMKISSMPSSALKIRNADVSATASPSPQRSNHGALGFAVKASPRALYQPQDGAGLKETSARRLLDISARLMSFPEPEDARLTGGTRSLMRRLLGLNLHKPASATAKSARSAA